jgi:hypothetical protein
MLKSSPRLSPGAMRRARLVAVKILASAGLSQVESYNLQGRGTDLASRQTRLPVVN